MALLGNTGITQALNSLDATAAGTNVIAFVALHTATPGTTGTSENAASGGYARQACTWNASSAGSAKTNSTALTFSTLGTVQVTHCAGWSASTAGTYGIGLALGANITAASITVASAALSLTAT